LNEEWKGKMETSYNLMKLKGLYPKFSQTLRLNKQYFPIKRISIVSDANISH